MDDVSLTLRPGEVTVLYGETGSGKTSLMKLVLGARATNGLLLVDGRKPRWPWPDLAYQGRYGFLPGRLPLARALTLTTLLRDSVRLDGLARPPVAERVDRALAALGLRSAARTPVDRLSHGQLTRAELAAVLAADPAVVLLDEPTTGLDVGRRPLVMRAVPALAEAGRTVLMITHEGRGVERADQLAFMAPGGRLVFAGTAAEAMDFFIPDDPQARPVPGAALPAEVLERIHALPDDEAAVRYDRARYETSVSGRLDLRAVDARSHLLAPAPALVPGLAWRQWCLLLVRQLELTWRDAPTLRMWAALSPLAALLLLFVFADSDLLLHDTIADVIKAQRLILLMVTFCYMAGIITAAPVIAREARLHLREALFGVGNVPYLLAKLAVLILVETLQVGAFVGLLRLGLSFPATGAVGPPLAEVFAALALTWLVGAATGLVLSALARSQERAFSLALLPHLQLGRVQPHVGDQPQQRPRPGALHLPVEALARVGDLARAAALHAERLDQRAHPPGRGALDVGLLDDGQQRPLGPPARPRSGRRWTA